MKRNYSRGTEFWRRVRYRWLTLSLADRTTARYVKIFCEEAGLK